MNSFLAKKFGSLDSLRIFLQTRRNKKKFSELQKQEYVRYENLPLETVDGRRIDVEFISNLYQVDHRDVIQCNIRDITERVRAEEKLRRSETNFRQTFDLSPVGIVLVGLDKRFIQCNNSFAQFLGYSEEESGPGHAAL